jgi:diaminopimelate epimerase
VDRQLLGTSGGPVDTGRGVLDCTVEADGQVRVDMGAPVLRPRDIPMLLDGERAVLTPLDVGAKRLLVTAVSMGNPHAIVFLEKGQDPRDWALRVGPALENHAAFPNRTNAEFALVLSPEEIDLVVWERGSGLTLACGTGACATVVAAALTDRVLAGSTVKVNLPGGPLRVRVEPDLSRVWMTGPAVEVFSGRV